MGGGLTSLVVLVTLPKMMIVHTYMYIRVGQKTRSVNNHNTCMLWPFLHIIGTTSQNFKDLGQCLRGSPEIAIFWTSGRFYTFAHVFRELKHMAPIKACHTTACHRSCLSCHMSCMLCLMSCMYYHMSCISCHMSCMSCDIYFM